MSSVSQLKISERVVSCGTFYEFVRCEKLLSVVTLNDSIGSHEGLELIACFLEWASSVVRLLVASRQLRRSVSSNVGLPLS